MSGSDFAAEWHAENEASNATVPATYVEAKNHKEHQVIGPPGTGKTFYLSKQVERLAKMPGYGPSSVMIGSLTRAAATEIAGRTELPRNAVGTFHGHAYRALDRPELAETPEGIKDWNAWLTSKGERASYRIEPGQGKDVEWAPPEAATSNSEGGDLLALLAVYRARMTPRELYPPRLEEFAERWSAFKDESNRYDFTDLIERAIDECPTPPAMPRVMMLDEAQDMSRLEFTLARLWGKACEQLVVVGDPWQNLYEWRGSDPAAFFAGEPDSQIVLARSRRVPRAVHEYAVRWISASPGDLPAFEYEPRFNDPNDENSGIAEGSVEKVGHVWTQPEGLVNRVIADLDEGRSVMILGSCGFMLDPTIKVLRERGVPFGNPYRPQHGGWNPLRGAGRLLDFLRPDPGTWGDEARMWSWPEVHRWVDPMRAKGVWDRGAKTFIESKSKSSKLDEKENAERPIEFETVRKLLLPAHHDQLFSLDVEWWLETLRDERKRQARYSVQVWRKHGGRALRQRPRIVIGTIHSVKGGEADSVYVFPDLSRQAWEGGWFNPADRGPIYRQFYVAFTRARERLTLCSPASGMYAQFPTTKESTT